jgi:hypothetical protein
MSDDSPLDEALDRIRNEPVDLDRAQFQKAVWARLEARTSRLPAGLARALAFRAAPAAIALVLGGVVGSTALSPDPEPDVLAVFEADSAWSLTALVTEGGLQ